MSIPSIPSEYPHRPARGGIGYHLGVLRMLVKNTVEDYNAWRRVFDEQPDALAASGLTLEWVRRDADDPGAVWFCLTCADRARADAFLADPANAEVGERAGVTGGEVIYLTDTDA